MGLILISMATPWISESVRVRWFTLPAMIAVASIPITTGIALLAARLLLGSTAVRGNLCWLPFALLVLVFLLSFLGLSYSIYPFVVIDRLTVWQAASRTSTVPSTSRRFMPNPLSEISRRDAGRGAFYLQPSGSLFFTSS